jgi:hypothetical protein
MVSYCISKQRILYPKYRPFGVIPNEERSGVLMKRNHEIKVRFNDVEYEDLLVKVSKSGLSRERFIRNLVNDVIFKMPASIEYFQLVNECNAIGNNLNQLTKLAYIYPEIDKIECVNLLNKLNTVLQTMEHQVHGDS